MGFDKLWCTKLEFVVKLEDSRRGGQHRREGINKDTKQDSSQGTPPSKVATKSKTGQSQASRLFIHATRTCTTTRVKHTCTKPHVKQTCTKPPSIHGKRTCTYKFPKREQIGRTSYIIHHTSYIVHHP